MGVADFLYPRDDAARKGNQTPANREPDGDDLGLDGRRLANLHWRDIRHEGWVFDGDHGQIARMVHEKGRCMVEGVLVVLADANESRVRDAVGAGKNAPGRNDDTGTIATARHDAPRMDKVRFGRLHLQLDYGVQKVSAFVLFDWLFSLSAGAARQCHGRNCGHRRFM